MWYGFTYVIIGFIIVYYYFEKKFGEEYRIAKNKGETEDATVCLYLILLVIIWPIVFCIIIYEKIKKCL